ncbi:tryptophan-specific permease [Geoglobus acetivorans]|uniref:Tryptophan-specific permease n=1 Tax=Geoglobus acetivorans TaxID=565033 RepID=A0A0A7GGC9_GEOAI|nr:tryptophan-specific permease [Geoglobus acetivorans]
MEIEVSLSLLLVFMGIVTLLVRDRPNPYVGVRMGYTYLSREAWKKANAFAGAYSVLVGVAMLLAVLLLNPPIHAFIAIYLLSLVPLVYVSYRIAKETYEMEDMSSPPGEMKPFSAGSVEKPILLQTVPLLAYLLIAALSWNSLPDVVAVHFTIDGTPDGFAGKIAGILVIPSTVMLAVIALTAFSAKEPLILRLPVERPYVVFLTVQVLLAAVFTATLIYNLGLVSGKVVLGTAFSGLVFVLLVVVWLSRSSG